MSKRMITYLFGLRLTISSEKNSLISSNEQTYSTSSCIESIDEAEIEPPPPKLKNLNEAVRNLSQEFLDNKGYISEATIIA